MFQTFTEMLPQPELTAGLTGTAGGLRRHQPSKARSSTQAIGSGALIRLLDIVIAVAALVFFLPLMVMIALAILVTGGGPIFFVQARVGRNGVEFRCFKFRTMSNDAEAILAAVLNSNADAYAEWSRFHKLRDDPRVGRLGAILRKTSLDELPQLFNVLRGDMSVVGPRPIVAKEASRYGRYFVSYCAVRPGITGLWQVSGRNDTTYRRRVACDVVYSRNKSAGNDLKIIFKTVPVVLFARGAY